MKRNITALCLCLLLLVLLPAGCAPRFRGSYSYTGNVTVSVGLGTRASFSQGRTIPVIVTVTGDYAASDHSVTVTVPTNAGDFYCYQKHLTDEAHQEVTFVVPAAADSTQMVVEILDGEEHVVYSRTCSYQFSDVEGKTGEIVAGLIGVDNDRGFWNFPYAYGDYHFLIRTVDILTDYLPEEPEAFHQYNLLVVSQEAVEEMTQEQKDGICGWVKKGGRLLLIGNTKTAGKLGLDTDRKTESAGFSENAYLNGYEAGGGMLWIVSRRTFLKEYSEGEQITMLEIMLDGGLLSALLQEQNQEKTAAAVVDALDSQESVTQVADSRIYYLIFIIYLLILLPGGWLFLRRKDKLSWFRLLVCLLACLVCGLIWIAGKDTRFSDPFLHSISIFGYGRGRVRQTTYFSVQAPYNHSYEVSLLPGWHVMPLQTDERWSGTSYSQYERHTAKLDQRAEETCLQMDNLIAFAPRYFEMWKEEESELTISGEIQWNADEIDGIFTNQLDCDLREAVILAGDRVFLLDEWKAGDTVTLSEACQQGMCTEVSLEQFLEDSYRRPDGWDSQYSELYIAMVRQWSNGRYGNAVVMAVMEKDAAIQKDTGYEQSGISFALVQTSVN